MLKPLQTSKLHYVYIFTFDSSLGIAFFKEHLGEIITLFNKDGERSVESE